MASNRKPIEQWTRADFDALPERKRFDSAEVFSMLVILPTRTRHDSGFRCMDFAGVNDNGVPVRRLSGCSDTLNLDGISGPDYRDRYGEGPQPRHVAWRMDCLPVSGLLRIWPGHGLRVRVGDAVSSLEVFSVPAASPRTETVATRGKPAASDGDSRPEAPGETNERTPSGSR